MLNLESKYFNEYYGENPDFYSIAYMHYNMEIFDDEKNEYKLIEEDLKQVKSYIKDLFKIYFSECETFFSLISNTEILDKYYNDIYLRINSESELDKINGHSELSGLNIIVSYKDINNYKVDDINKYQIVLQIDTVSELSSEQLDELKKTYNIKQIIVGQICYLNSYFMPYFKRIGKKFNIDYLDQLSIEKQGIISNDNYTVDEYIKIYNEIIKLVSGININEDEIDRFKSVYDRITNKIAYNHSDVQYSNLNDQNLVGGLFYNTCVCEGYSKVLQQALSLVGIECIVVGGGGAKKDGGHIWNQVKINDIWYNADVTYDSIQVHENKTIELCLVADDTLYYKTDYLIAKKCIENYDFNKKDK